MQLIKRGIYAGVLIKRRRYWPKFIPGNTIDNFMSTKETGEITSLVGKLDGYNYSVFVMKEPDYTSKIMATYGNLLSDNGWEERSKRKEDS